MTTVSIRTKAIPASGKLSDRVAAWTKNGHRLTMPVLEDSFNEHERVADCLASLLVPYDVTYALGQVREAQYWNEWQVIWHD